MKHSLFLHTQKTAGTSVQVMARWAYGNDNVCSHADFVDLGVEGCAKLPFVSGHFGIEFAKPLMRGRYCFTFLRDPIERLISFYTFCAAQDSDKFPIYAAARNNSMEDFFRLGLPHGDLSHTLWNHQVWQLAHGNGAYLVGKRLGITSFEPGDLLEAGKQNLSLFDYVGLVETFDEDIAEIFSHLGKPDEIIRKSNVSPKKSNYEDLSPATRQILLDLTELDRALYSHVRELRAKSAQGLSDLRSS